MANILVTGAGGPAAISFMKAVATDGHTFIAADMDPHAAGLYMEYVAHRALIPAGKSPELVPALLELCREYKVDLLVPTVDYELLPIAREAARFDAIGVRIAISPLEALERCLDKYQLYKTCCDALLCPSTVVLEPRIMASGDLIAKPRSGSGSRGIRRIRGEAIPEDLPRDGSYILQSYLPGTEYSVDVYIDRTGEPLAAVPRERMKVDSGVAVTARTVRDAALENAAIAAAKAVGIRGVANVQLRRDAAGRPRLLEINPRFPGTMPLTVAAGVPMPTMTVDEALGGTLTRPARFRELAMVRTLAETFMDPAVLQATEESACVA